MTKIQVQEIGVLIPYEACPLCGHDYEGKIDRWRVVIEPRLRGRIVPAGDVPIGTGYRVCPTCGFIHQHSHLPPDLLHQYYTDSTYREIVSKSDAPTVSSVYNEAHRAIYLSDKVITKWVREADSILDIGSSAGFMLQRLDQTYLPDNIVGVDPNRIYQEYVRGYGFDVYSTIEDIPTLPLFDLVTCIHTLEHVIQPVDFLFEIWRRMSVGGHLVIEVPNAYAPRNMNLWHVVCFSKHTLQTMLEMTGFEVLYIKAHSKPEYRLGKLHITVVAKKWRFGCSGLHSREKNIKLKVSIGLQYHRLLNHLPKVIMRPFYPPRIVVPYFVERDTK